MKCMCVFAGATLLLSGCGKSYDVMPTGTHDVPTVTVEVPTEYLTVTDNDTNTTNDVESMTVDANDAKDAKERYAKFIDTLQGDVYISITRVKTVGESTQASEYQFTFMGDKGCCKYYNSEEQLISWTVSTADEAFLIDTVGETVYTAPHFDMSTRAEFITAYELTDVEFVSTSTEDFDGVALTCDMYTDIENVVVYKYYYDTDGNLIVIEKQKNGTQTHTLFNEIRTVELDETVFDIPEYKQEEYILDETTND